MKQRTLPKSISCGKTFRNHTALHTIDEVRHWLCELGKELEERVLEDRKVNARLPQLLTVSFYTPPEGLGKGQAGNGPGQVKGQDWQGGTSISRSCHLRKAMADCMADDATLLVSLNSLHAPPTSCLLCLHSMFQQCEFRLKIMHDNLVTLCNCQQHARSRASWLNLFLKEEGSAFQCCGLLL